MSNAKRTRQRKARQQRKTTPAQLAATLAERGAHLSKSGETLGTAQGHQLFVFVGGSVDPDLRAKAEVTPGAAVVDTAAQLFVVKEGTPIAQELIEALKRHEQEQRGLDR